MRYATSSTVLMMARPAPLTLDHPNKSGGDNICMSRGRHLYTKRHPGLDPRSILTLSCAGEPYGSRIATRPG